MGRLSISNICHPLFDLFADPGGLALLAPQVEQPGPAHASLADHLDLIDAGRQDREYPFDADPVRHLPDGESFAHGVLVPALHHDALELLDTLLVPFADLHMHVDRIPCLEYREFALPGEVFLFKFLQFVAHDFFRRKWSANICISPRMGKIKRYYFPCRSIA